MIEYFIKYYGKLLPALAEHIDLVLTSLFFSLLLAALLTLLSSYSRLLSKLLVTLFSIVYSIPSLAMFALLIPLTGLGRTTAILVLVMYNQYLLLRNFITGLGEVEPALVEAARGMGMTTFQILIKVCLPLSRTSIFAGVRLALVSTIGIATIAASIHAGGLGAILFDGLRTLHFNKIIWGSLLSAGLAVGANALLGFAEKKRSGKYAGDGITQSSPQSKTL